MHAKTAESVQYSLWFIKPASIFLQIRWSVRGRDDSNSFVTLVKCRKAWLCVTSNFASALPLSEQPRACMPSRAALSHVAREIGMVAPHLQGFKDLGGVSECKALATWLQQVPAHREKRTCCCKRCWALWSRRDLTCSFEPLALQVGSPCMSYHLSASCWACVCTAKLERYDGPLDGEEYQAKTLGTASMSLV